LSIDGKANTSDDILVSLIRHDDENAFRVLYDRYNKKIYFFSLRYLGNNYEAEELVQSTFINIWENRKSLNRDLPVKSYIYKAAVNYIYNFLKKKAIRARFVESEISKRETLSNLTYEEVFFRDLENSINSIVSTLPPRQQNIFRLSRYEGLTNMEIAKKLDLSVRTVENQMYRALNLIRNYLKKGVFLVMLLFSL
jgi:RNA polymerase sigma-70 factor (family 1)